MTAEEIETLKREYTGKYVVVELAAGDLRRWAGVVGQVKTVNQSGLALVQFLGADHAWHDIALDHLRLTEPPAAEPPAKPAGVKKAP